MIWALIATIPQEITYLVPDSGSGALTIPGYWATTMVEPGTVVNIIVYEEGADYTPPDATRLAQVPDDTQIGATGF